MSLTRYEETTDTGKIFKQYFSGKNLENLIKQVEAAGIAAGGMHGTGGTIDLNINGKIYKLSKIWGGQNNDGTVETGYELIDPTGKSVFKQTSKNFGKADNWEKLSRVIATGNTATLAKAPVAEVEANKIIPGRTFKNSKGQYVLTGENGRGIPIDTKILNDSNYDTAIKKLLAETTKVENLKTGKYDTVSKYKELPVKDEQDWKVKNFMIGMNVSEADAKRYYSSLDETDKETTPRILSQEQIDKDVAELEASRAAASKSTPVKAASATKTDPNEKITAYNPATGQAFQVLKSEFDAGVYKGWTTTPISQPSTPASDEGSFSIAGSRDTTAPTNLTISDLLKNPKVQQDKGVNGTTMAKWLQGNASLIPKLASLGYTVDDLINEAYAQTRYNRSAFSGDMTTTNRNRNTPYSGGSSSSSNTNTSGTTPPSSTTPPATSGKQATLTSSDGQYKVVVIVGSPEASRLLSSGWALGDTGTKVITLDDALGGGSSGESPSSGSSDASGLTPEQKKGLDDLNAYIDSMPYDMAQKAVLKQIASNDYTSGQKILQPAELSRVIDEATVAASSDLSPYFEVLTKREIQDLEDKMLDIRNESARFKQQEEFSYAKKLASTKQNLRASGLTFSGQAKRLTGTEGFINAKDQYFPGGYEGEIQKERRYDWEDARAGWQEDARDIGLAAERSLGSAKVPAYVELPDPYKTTENKGNLWYNNNNYQPTLLAHKVGMDRYVEIGDTDLQKKKAIEESKWNRIGAYRANI
jgi:hypothetical protein